MTHQICIHYRPSHHSSQTSSDQSTLALLFRGEAKKLRSNHLQYHSRLGYFFCLFSRVFLILLARKEVPRKLGKKAIKWAVAEAFPFEREHQLLDFAPRQRQRQRHRGDFGTKATRHDMTFKEYFLDLNTFHVGETSCGRETARACARSTLTVSTAAASPTLAHLPSLALALSTWWMLILIIIQHGTVFHSNVRIQTTPYGWLPTRKHMEICYWNMMYRLDASHDLKCADTQYTQAATRKLPHTIFMIFF